MCRACRDLVSPPPVDQASRKWRAWAVIIGYLVLCPAVFGCSAVSGCSGYPPNALLVVVGACSVQELRMLREVSGIQVAGESVIDIGVWAHKLGMEVGRNGWVSMM